MLAPVKFNSAAPSCDCVAHRFGNAADHPERVRRYPSDMTDAEWAVVRPLLPVPGWLRGRGGRPEAYCHRAILDAIRYLVDNGIKWRAMPGDFPPWDRVYAFFRRWRDHVLVQEFHDRLRGRVRQEAGRDAEPTAGVIDSQSVKADAVVGADRGDHPAAEAGTAVPGPLSAEAVQLDSVAALERAVGRDRAARRHREGFGQMFGDVVGHRVPGLRRRAHRMSSFVHAGLMALRKRLTASTTLPLRVSLFGSSNAR
ncbi:transposase [Streptomyces sp. CC219B]|uniref:transposase n=1 Tax=Streptomyces sp. CC219B TaxID=3044574 RepID=UPI0024A87984|nr:transposase [Streptomyces sp. CC219B]